MGELGLNMRFTQRHNHGSHLDLFVISNSREVPEMQLENLLTGTIMWSSKRSSKMLQQCILQVDFVIPFVSMAASLMWNGMPYCSDYWRYKGNNSLGVHFNSSWSRQLYHECVVLFEEPADIYSYTLRHLLTPQKIQKMVVGGDRKWVESFTFQYIEIAFRNISFGSNGYGIHQLCYPENSNSIQEGLFIYLLKGLVDQLNSKLNALGELDSLCKKCQSIESITVIASSTHKLSFWFLQKKPLY